ncbi:MAG: hypothetical protein WC505_06745 [Patescibacteria group bacterium]
MAIQPGASLQSKYDQTRSYFQRREEYALTAATVLVEEGQLAVRAGTSLTTVTTSTGAALEMPVGVMLLGEIDANTFTWVETFTIPNAAIPTFTLKYNNLAPSNYTLGLADNSDIYVYDNTAAGQMAQANPAPADNQFSCTAATGVLRFHINDIGHSVTARYRWTLTTPQSREIVRQSAVGRGSENTYRKVIIGRGNNCRIYTTMYSPQALWTLNLQSGLLNSPALGAGGIWSTVTQSTTGVPFGRVIQLPSLNDPYLGIEYTTP